MCGCVQWRCRGWVCCRWMSGSDRFNYWLRTMQHQKALRETQTLRAGCSEAEPIFFRPAADPLSGVQDGQNLISSRWSPPSPTDPVWWRSMRAISSYRGNSPTNKQTHKQTHKHTGPITIHCAAKLSAQCNKSQTRMCCLCRCKCTPNRKAKLIKVDLDDITVKGKN